MKRILLAIALLCGYTVVAQTAASLVGSGEIIAAGSKLHDQEKYPEAIEQYKKVSRSDTNYTLALSEMALTYTVQKKYKEAIRVSEEGLKLNSSRQLDLLLRLANAYDEAGDYVQAERVYEQGIRLFPHSHQLYFEKGVSLLRQKQASEAVRAFQQAIERNYFHASSHRALGMVCLATEYKAQGLLSLMTYLMLDSYSQTSASTLTYMEEHLTKEIDTPDSLKSLKLTDVLPEANRLLKSKMALDSRYEAKSTLNYRIVKQMQALLEKLPDAVSGDDFWMQKYVAFYKSIWQNPYFEPMTYYAMASVDEKASKRFQKPDKGMKTFREWASAQMNQLRSSRPNSLNGIHKVYYHTYHSNGRLQGICESYDAATSRMSGACEFYHASGYLFSKGVYNAAGERTGEWKHYTENGKLDYIETYQNNQITYQSYYSNGSRHRVGVLQNGKIDGLLTTYSPSDAKTLEITFKDGQRHGPFREFYLNGTLKTEGNYVDGEKEGIFKEYYRHKGLATEQHFKKGKEEGLYRAYYPSGKLQTEGSSVNGAMTGIWKWYHSNGKLEKEGNFVQGKEEGLWKTYYKEGALETEIPYTTGLITGLFRTYDKDGKLYSEQAYDKGKLKSLRYYDKQGKLLGESVAKGNTIALAVTYYPDGVRKSEGKMVDGNAEGLWKFYHRTGWLMRETTYKNDQREGLEKTYYADGSVQAETYYHEGVENGSYKSYFPNKKRYAEGWYVNGNAEGEWLYYYRNGELEKRSYFLNDENEGYLEYNHPNGKLHEENHYTNQILDWFTMYDSTGKAYQTVYLEKGNGQLTTLYPNGKTSQIITFHHGVRDGEVKGFHPTGKPIYLQTYQYEQQHGPSVSYFASGVPSVKSFYKFGQRDSLYQTFYEDGKKRYECWYEEGECQGKMQWFYPDGTIEVEGTEKDDMREGFVTYYSPDGVVRYRLNYHQDIPLSYSYQDAQGHWLAEIPIVHGTGSVKAYFPNGNLSFEGSFEKGQRHGVQRYFYTNGKLQREGHLYYGLNHGEQKEYHSNGALKRIYLEEYDQQEGLEKEYSEQGTLIRQTPYVMGDVHGVQQVYTTDGKPVQTRKFIYDINYE